MDISKKDILRNLLKVLPKKYILLFSIYIILNILNLCILPLISMKIRLHNQRLLILLILSYLIFTYLCLNLKNFILDISNIERINRIEDSFKASININYQFFESKKGQDLFNKSVQTTNSSSSPFSLVYIKILDFTYSLIYVFINVFFAISNVSYTYRTAYFITIFFVFFLSILKMNHINIFDKSILELFIKKEKNYRYLRKLSEKKHIPILLKIFKGQDFIDSKFKIEDLDLSKKISSYKNKKIYGFFVYDLLIFFILLFLFLFLNIDTNKITLIVLVYQIIAVSYIFASSFLNLREIFEKISSYFSYIKASQKDTSSKKIKIEKIEKIEFKNVYFKYENSNFSLKDVSFSLKENEKLGIFGLNGSGKSTISKLLLGFYQVDQGDILINDISIKDIANLNDIISCVFQDDTLIPASIEENIRFGREYDEKRFSEVIKKSSFDKVMIKNELSKESLLISYFLEGGIDLSEGESQLLFLARCLYKNASLMVWDEPSSSLDPFKERDLFERYVDIARNSLGIFITHKASNIDMFDKIIYLENGEIIEMGSFDQLMENKGKYYDMYQKQEY